MTGTVPNSSRTTLTELQYNLQTTTLDISGILYVASESIAKFLSNPNSESDWDIMVLLINEFLKNNSLQLTGLNVCITLSDGRVAYDSTAGVLNTFANFQEGLISNNINLSLVIQQALLSRSGTGFETTFSTNHTETRSLMAYNATRMGLSTSNSLGCARVGYIVG